MVQAEQHASLAAERAAAELRIADSKAMEEKLAELLTRQREGFEAQLQQLGAESERRAVAQRAAIEERRQLNDRILQLEQQLAEAIRAAKKPPSSVAIRHAETKEGTRRIGSVLPGIDIDETSDVSVVDQLREALSANAGRVIDLFREWDVNMDGRVSLLEFRKAMPLLGFHVQQSEVDVLFHSMDPDGSNSIEYNELKKLLRRRAPAAYTGAAATAASAPSDSATSKDGGKGRAEPKAAAASTRNARGAASRPR